MYLHMQVCAFFFGLQLIDRWFLCLRVKACRISRRTSWSVCGQEHWGMRAEASYGIKVLFPPLLMASGVSAWSHSASPHLLRTKRGLVGVHTTKLHSKGVGQGDSSPLPAVCLFPKTRLCFLYVCLSISVSCSFITQKKLLLE